ncbi:thaumatin-like protein 1 isoform X2 [Andrographis paniculata]|uniref:thaumatin-like protein 1 isoform X2 n=1 Tax=Andrographis paniculata TaxID=175694 RepID=UPI0021E73ACB|nr:thaumatin-like protein 1 isoform X2 [Andrographis paniculata]
MLPSLLHTFILLAIANGCLGTTFTLINRCEYTVWPGILSNAGAGGFGTTGFQLPQGAARSFQAGPGWSGRFWGRTGCVFDPATGQGSCATGDCGSNQIECNGAGAKPPATLAEFTIGSDTQDFYDVSLVDGYNLPMIVEAAGGSGACGSTGCLTDLNRICPSELRVGNGQACRSACEAFRRPEFCCSGAYGSPDTCRPSAYSAAFKKACPRAYSYAYDDATSTFTCNGADYTITFCPSLPRNHHHHHLHQCRHRQPAVPQLSHKGTTTSTTAGSRSPGGCRISSSEDHRRHQPCNLIPSLCQQ